MGALSVVPTAEELTSLVGKGNFEKWQAFRKRIEGLYDTDILWADGGKRWTFELKYRRGGKTLCALYAKPNCIGLLVIFGKDEREKAESILAQLDCSTALCYTNAHTYHDGKWVMFDNDTPIEDIEALLLQKRKPNRK